MTPLKQSQPGLPAHNDSPSSSCLPHLLFSQGWLYPSTNVLAHLRSRLPLTELTRVEVQDPPCGAVSLEVFPHGPPCKYWPLWRIASSFDLTRLVPFQSFHRADPLSDDGCSYLLRSVEGAEASLCAVSVLHFRGLEFDAGCPVRRLLRSTSYPPSISHTHAEPFL